LSNSHLPLLQACARSLAAGWARAMRRSRASKHERRREGRTSTEARGPPAQKNAGGRYHRSSRTTRPSLRDSFTVSFVLSLGTGLSCPHHPRSRSHISSRLDLSIGRPGPHDFAVRDAHARLAQHQRPSQPTSTYRDDAYALCMRRDIRSEAQFRKKGKRNLLRRGPKVAAS